jgi:hypothetical protein
VTWPGELLFHPWRWHRKPRPFLVNCLRALAEAVLAAAVITVISLHAPWPAGWRIAADDLYAACAAASVFTMRRS